MHNVGLCRPLLHNCFFSLFFFLIQPTTRRFSQVSRERYGIELLKMLTPPSRSADALQSMVDFDLPDIVFSLPDASSSSSSSSNAPAVASASSAASAWAARGAALARRVQDLVHARHSFLELAGGSGDAPSSAGGGGSLYTSAQHRDSHLAAFLAPLHGRVFKLKSRTLPVAWHVIMNSIKVRLQ